MPDPMTVKAYYGISVTTPADSNPHRLLTLLQAVDPTVPGSCGGLMLQSDDANGANPVLVGASDISSSSYGYKLLVHEGNPVRTYPFSTIPLSEIYILSPNGVAVQVNVEIIVW